MARHDVAVVGGCGAVGTVFSTALALGGASVVVVSRGVSGCSPVALEARGLGSASLLVCGWGSAAALRPRVVVYAVKAYSLRGAVEASQRAGWSPVLVAGLQNGLGALELLEEAYPGRAAQGLVYYGVERLAPCRAVLHAVGAPRVVLGCRPGRCLGKALEELEALAALLRRGGVEAVVVEDVEPWRWMKLAVNAAINPVTALTGAPNRIVVEDRDARSLAEALAREVGRVAEALGVRLPGDPVAEALRVAELTGDNRSSMLQDLEAGRPTEVDYINGAVAAWARRLGLEAPVNETVWRLIRVLERLRRGKAS